VVVPDDAVDDGDVMPGAHDDERTEVGW